MENEQCKQCVYYRQHYVFFAGKLISVYCGHCLKKIRKKMRPDAKSCDQFEENTTALSDIFASKEYLTKELLEKVMEMDLLPEIESE